ncbi:MAG: SMI1/KNR4 family protein [Planctomycetota bacterium]
MSTNDDTSATGIPRDRRMLNSSALRQCLVTAAAVVVLVVAAIPLFFSSPAPEPAVRSHVRGRVIGETITATGEAEIAERIELLWNQVRLMVKDQECFNSGATEQQIEEVEHMLGVRLPPDYRAFLKICNGQSKWSYHGLHPMPLSTSDLATSLYSHIDYLPRFDQPQRIGIYPDREYPDQVEVDNWHPSLMVIANIDGIGYVLELESGRILHWDHDGWSFRYCFESFEELLKATIEKGPDEKGFVHW